MIPEELSSKIANLSMTPADWTSLDRSTSSEEYCHVVREYQKREREKLPRCSSLFGLCTCYDYGVCCCKDSCDFKIS